MASEPIPEMVRINFDQLVRAFARDEACCLASTRSDTGEPVYLICAMNKEGDQIDLVPFASMILGNPFEEFAPPDALDGDDGNPRVDEEIERLADEALYPGDDMRQLRNQQRDELIAEQREHDREYDE